MTVAICLECGAFKHGALTRCSDCGFEPAENLDKARSVVLSDHFLSGEDLAAAGESIQAGETIGFPEEVVAEYVAAIEQGADKRPARILLGCAIAAVVAVVLLVALVLRLL